MRKQRTFIGINDSQKIRFILGQGPDAFMMFCQVRDIENIASQSHRMAVYATLEKLSLDRAMARNQLRLTGELVDLPTGLSWMYDYWQDAKFSRTIPVQVDIIEE